MTCTGAIKHCVSNYATFKGRASRPEYWFFWLFSMLVFVAMTIVTLVLVGISAAADTGGWLVGIWIAVCAIAALGLVIPSISVAVRRLHDTHNSGWMWWIQVVPYLGTMVFLVILLMPTYPVNNKYGEYTPS